MRTLRLARIAAEAEGLRLRHQVQRTVTRAVFGIVALVFLFATLVFAHVALWAWIRLHFERQQTALIIGGGDLVLAIVCAVLAARSSPSQVEVEALEIRRRAISNVGGTLAWSGMAVQVLRVFARLRSRRRD